jgi:hypothetical protein
MKRGLAKFHAAGAHTFDDGGQNGISFSQVADGFAMMMCGWHVVPSSYIRGNPN